MVSDAGATKTPGQGARGKGQGGKGAILPTRWDGQSARSGVRGKHHGLARVPIFQASEQPGWARPTTALPRRTDGSGALPRLAALARRRRSRHLQALRHGLGRPFRARVGLNPTQGVALGWRGEPRWGVGRRGRCVRRHLLRPQRSSSPVRSANGATDRSSSPVRSTNGANRPVIIAGAKRQRRDRPVILAGAKRQRRDRR